VPIEIIAKTVPAILIVLGVLSWWGNNAGFGAVLIIVGIAIYFIEFFLG
jgi:hypothetical protein